MDVQEGSRLQLQAFEAINEVVRSASSDTLPLVGQLIQALLDKLASTFRMQIASSEAREHQNDLQVRNTWSAVPCINKYSGNGLSTTLTTVCPVAYLHCCHPLTCASSNLLDQLKKTPSYLVFVICSSARH